MRASSGVFAAALFVASTNLSDAATLSPKEIQSEFFNGKPFTASTSSNTKFTMMFTGDGKVTRKPQGDGGGEKVVREEREGERRHVEQMNLEGGVVLDSFPCGVMAEEFGSGG